MSHQNTPKKRKWYAQCFKQEWLMEMEFKEWLEQDSNDKDSSYCKACKVTLKKQVSLCC